MERGCFLFTVRPGQEQEYDERHRHVWPELLDELRAAGVRSYSLFRSGRTVIAYAECEPDVGTAFGAVAATQADRRWQAHMSGVLEPVAGEDGRLRLVPEVFHLSG